jgi:hypothetical protein
MGRRGRRCKQLLDYVKEKRRYRNLKEEAIEWTLFGNTALKQAMDPSQDRLRKE